MKAFNSCRSIPADNAIAVTTAQGCLHARDSLVRNTLQQADVEAHLVPLDGLFKSKNRFMHCKRMFAVYRHVRER